MRSDLGRLGFCGTVRIISLYTASVSEHDANEQLATHFHISHIQVQKRD
jgi:hypothetical protein